MLPCLSYDCSIINSSGPLACFSFSKVLFTCHCIIWMFIMLEFDSPDWYIKCMREGIFVSFSPCSRRWMNVKPYRRWLKQTAFKIFWCCKIYTSFATLCYPPDTGIQLDEQQGIILKYNRVVRCFTRITFQRSSCLAVSLVPGFIPQASTSDSGPFMLVSALGFVELLAFPSKSLYYILANSPFRISSVILPKGEEIAACFTVTLLKYAALRIVICHPQFLCIDMSVI